MAEFHEISLSNSHFTYQENFISMLYILICILYIEYTNKALCFLLFQSLIGILYIDNPYTWNYQLLGTLDGEGADYHDDKHIYSHFIYQANFIN